jgi:hypothetical protein
VEDDVGPVDQGSDVARPEIRLDDFGPWKTSQRVQGFFFLGDVVIGGQTVDRDDHVSVGGQPFHEMASDETGGSCDQGSHLVPTVCALAVRTHASTVVWRVRQEHQGPPPIGLGLAFARNEVFRVPCTGSIISCARVPAGRRPLRVGAGTSAEQAPTCAYAKRVLRFTKGSSLR